MQKKSISMILYPVMTVKINKKQKTFIIELLKKEFKGIQDDELINIFDVRLSRSVMKNEALNIKEDDRLKYFKIAKSILEIIDVSKCQLEALAELGKALKIDSKDTGFSFNLYNIEDINQYEFQKTIRTFSKVAAAIGFIPFIPIADFTILSSIQIGMLAKISNIYQFKLEPKQFLKMVGGTLGIGVVFRTSSKILCNFIPFVGWGINALVAFAGTYAIGIIAKRYIEANGDLTKDSIKSIWEKSYKEGKKEFLNLKEYIFKKKDELTKEFEKYKKQENSSKGNKKK